MKGKEKNVLDVNIRNIPDIHF